MILGFTKDNIGESLAWCESVFIGDVKQRSACVGLCTFLQTNLIYIEGVGDFQDGALHTFSFCSIVCGQIFYIHIFLLTPSTCDCIVEAADFCKSRKISGHENGKRGPRR